jgi:acyl carrier protein
LADTENGRRAELLVELSELLIKDLRLDHCRRDSVDAAHLVAADEQRYAVRLGDTELMSGALETLGALADALLKRGASASRARASDL